MKKAIAIATIALAVTGCSSQSTLMVQPDTGTQIDCSARGWGWYGAPAAAASHRRCVREFSAQGWEKRTAHGMEDVDTTFPPHPDGNDWSVRRAKYALRDTTVTRSEYDRIVTHIRTIYDIDVRTAKSEYKSRLITKARYEQKVRDAANKYKG